jgi:hypothetical protein
MAELVGEVGGELFQYNREGWKFGAELRQRDLYQRQKMRIKQVDLYRDDIRDLFGLTVGKMDKYVIVCLVMLSITMEMFFKGRNPVGTPSWLFWCWSICTAGAMLYLLMSIWLALHASISAQTFSVRCLSQWLRIPIPSASEIAKGAARLEEYEKSGGEALLRVPVLGKADIKATGLEGTQTHQTGPQDLTTAWQLFSSHFELFNRLHRKWQGYEAYARVCMCLGVNHFLGAMSYFSLAVYALDLQSPWAGWAFVTIFQSSAVLHARLNLTLNFSETVVMVILVVIPPLFLSIAVAVTMTAPDVGGISDSMYELGPCLLACIGILGHVAWIIFFLLQTKSDMNGLPVKFSTVWCIDVLGFGMETLREVQEPVGKATYMSKLPGYGKGGPRNTFTLGLEDDEEPSDPMIDDLVPETLESIRRSVLPWSVFKVGSAFTVVLWGLALLQTVLIVANVDIGTVNVSRRLIEESQHVILDTTLSSVRGFIRDDDGILLADDFSILNGDGLRTACKNFPQAGSITALTGSVRRPLVLLRSTSSILDCVSGHMVDSPIGVSVDSITIDSTGDIFGLVDKELHYLDPSVGRWILMSDSRTYPSGSILGSRQDGSVVILNGAAQTVDIYDPETGKTQTNNVKDSDVWWTHTDGNSIIGISRKDKYRVIKDI